MNDNIQKEVQTLKPFKHFCMSIGELPSSYLETMTYYEMLVWFTKYLGETVIPTINENAEAVKELQTLFVELQNYVNNYFDNLDVQEEINNKLDDMAEDGTLEQIVGEYIEDLVQYIFPKFETNQYSSDSNLILYKNKSILIDTSSVNYFGTLRNMLNNYNISHIDYLIITHYHGDHTGGIESLINEDYIDSTTTILMPAEVTAYGQTITDAINHFKQVFENNNLTYRVPEENEVLTIENNLKLKFYNCDADYLDSQHDVGTHYDYNECSTQILVTFKNTQSLYTADAWIETLKRMRVNNFVKGQIDLYKVEHHGVNHDTDNKFIHFISPKYAVQNGGILDEVKDNFVNCETLNILNSLGTIIYSSQKQTDYIEFTSNGYSMTCKQGKANKPSLGINDKILYVNINASKNDIQDGSQEKPFSEIMQAVVYALNYPSNIISINLANGLYCHSDPAVNNRNNWLILRNCKDKLIRIYGNSEDRTAVILNTVWLSGANVEFHNLTIYNDYNNQPGINSINSDFILNNVLITSRDGEKSNNNGLTIGYHSRAMIINSKIENCNKGISLNNSFVNIDSLTFGDQITTKLDKNNAARLTTRQINFETDAERYDFDDFYPSVEAPHIVYNNSDKTTGFGEITLARSLANFDWVEIEYSDSWGNYCSTGKIYYPNNIYVPANLFYGTDQGAFICKQASFHLVNNKITIGGEKTLTLTNGNNPSVVISSNIIRIARVVVGQQSYQWDV